MDIDVRKHAKSTSQVKKWYGGASWHDLTDRVEKHHKAVISQSPASVFSLFIPTGLDFMLAQVLFLVYGTWSIRFFVLQAIRGASPVFLLYAIAGSTLMYIEVWNASLFNKQSMRIVRVFTQNPRRKCPQAHRYYPLPQAFALDSVNTSRKPFCNWYMNIQKN